MEEHSNLSAEGLTHFYCFNVCLSLSHHWDIETSRHRDIRHWDTHSETNITWLHMYIIVWLEWHSVPHSLLFQSSPVFAFHWLDLRVFGVCIAIPIHRPNRTVSVCLLSGWTVVRLSDCVLMRASMHTIQAIETFDSFSDLHGSHMRYNTNETTILSLSRSPSVRCRTVTCFR